jgi:hypothetical protein
VSDEEDATKLKWRRMSLRSLLCSFVCLQSGGGILHDGGKPQEGRHMSVAMPPALNAKVRLAWCQKTARLCLYLWREPGRNCDKAAFGVDQAHDGSARLAQRTRWPKEGRAGSWRRRCRAACSDQRARWRCQRRAAHDLRAVRDDLGEKPVGQSLLGSVADSHIRSVLEINSSPECQSAASSAGLEPRS